jgi:hypothetical protein
MSTKAPHTPEQKDLDIGEVYTRTELFFEKNKKAVSIGVTAVLVVVLGVLGYKKFIAEPKAEEARNAIWKAEYYFEIDSLDLAMNGDGNFMGMQAIADAYGSTPSGELAHFYMGTILLQKGDHQGAIDHYKEADLDDEVLRVMAVGNQGDALVELGKVDEAVAQFEKAADMVNSEFTTPMYLMKAGILHQQKGDWKAAARAFGRVAKDYSSSPDAMTARKLAARAEQMASNG